MAMLPFAAWTLATLLATTLVALFATDPRDSLCRALGRCLDAKPAVVPPVTVSSEPAVTSPALPSLRELTTVESATTRSTPSSIASSTRCLESRSCALATRPPSAIASRPSAIVPPVDPIASWDVALLSVAALVFAVIFLSRRPRLAVDTSDHWPTADAALFDSIITTETATTSPASTLDDFPASFDSPENDLLFSTIEPLAALQAAARGHLSRASFRTTVVNLASFATLCSTAALQAAIRGQSVRRRHIEQVAALVAASPSIILLQARIRGVVGLEACRRWRVEVEIAAHHGRIVELQSLARSALVRRTIVDRFRHPDKSLVVFQALLRVVLARRRAAERRIALAAAESATVRLQSAIRAQFVRSRFVRLQLVLALQRDVIGRLQARARGYLLRRRLAAVVMELRRTQTAVVALQSVIRSVLSWRRQTRRRTARTSYSIGTLLALRPPSPLVPYALVAKRLHAVCRGVLVRRRLADDLADARETDRSAMATVQAVLLELDDDFSDIAIEDSIEPIKPVHDALLPRTTVPVKRPRDKAARPPPAVPDALTRGGRGKRARRPRRTPPKDAH